MECGTFNEAVWSKVKVPYMWPLVLCSTEEVDGVSLNIATVWDSCGGRFFFFVCDIFLANLVCVRLRSSDCLCVCKAGDLAETLFFLTKKLITFTYIGLQTSHFVLRLSLCFNEDIYT